MNNSDAVESTNQGQSANEQAENNAHAPYTNEDDNAVSSSTDNVAGDTAQSSPEGDSTLTEEQSLHMGYNSLMEAIEDTENTSQLEALGRMLNRESVFLSGVAGAGKSYVIERFVTILRNHYASMSDDPGDAAGKVVVTAATGMAATNIGGTTIHSYSGLGICSEPLDRSKLFDRDYQRGVKLSYGFFSAYRKMRNLEALVIDEVSMLNAVFIDNLDLVLRSAKKSEQPFGGVTMIFAGDFMQLPPVSGQYDKTEYAFESEAWKELNPKRLFMSKSRRSTDNRLNSILADMREGKLSEETKKYLTIAKENEEKDSYVRLFTRNKNVDDYNQQRLNELPGQPYIFTPEARPLRHRLSPATPKTFDKSYKQTLGKLRVADEKGEIKPLALKVGAVVMVNRNSLMDSTIGRISVVNGDTGVVTGFNMESGVIKVKLNRNDAIVSVYRITEVAECGTPYKIPQGEQFSHPVATYSNDPAFGFSSGAAVVLNSATEGGADPNSNTPTNNSNKVITRDAVLARYYPLQLSFATTIHKSQGQTLNGVVVDLSNCFSPGLGYVALSRVSDLSTLKVSKIGRSAFLRSKKCAQFSLDTESEAKKNREDFIEQADIYDTIISSPLLLKVNWV